MSITERAPWTGTTVDYDEAVGRLALAQRRWVEAPTVERRRVAERALREARKAVQSAAEDMIAWSTSRASLAIQYPDDADRAALSALDPAPKEESR
jgi:hypothetical protein